MADDLKYGYKGAEPTQSFGNNTGVFDPNDINNLIADNKWTTFGQLELIETQTVSGVTQADFTNIKEDIYNVHFLIITNYQNSTNADDVIIQLFESGTIETGNVYENAYQEASSSNRFNEYRSISDNNLLSLSSSGNSASRNGNGYMYLYNAGNSSLYTHATFHSIGDYTTILGHALSYFGGGVLPQTSTVDGIRIKSLYYTNTSSFTASLYGIREHS